MSRRPLDDITDTILGNEGNIMNGELLELLAAEANEAQPTAADLALMDENGDPIRYAIPEEEIFVHGVHIWELDPFHPRFGEGYDGGEDGDDDGGDRDDGDDGDEATNDYGGLTPMAMNHFNEMPRPLDI